MNGKLARIMEQERILLSSYSSNLNAENKETNKKSKSIKDEEIVHTKDSVEIEASPENGEPTEKKKKKKKSRQDEEVSVESLANNDQVIKNEPEVYEQEGSELKKKKKRKDIESIPIDENEMIPSEVDFNQNDELTLKKKKKKTKIYDE